MRKLLSFVALLAASFICSGQTITTAVGGGVGDGAQATIAGLSRPAQVAIDGSGNVFIADALDNRIRRVDATTGIITTYAGTGDRFYSGDGGPATAATLNFPRSIAFDPGGNLIIADTGNRLIRRVDAGTGVITRLAGSNVEFGFYGDGGPATQAYFTFPESVALDGAGNIYIADESNHRVRRIASGTGIITTVAGGGGGGDGSTATNVSLDYPIAVALSAAGDLYIGERYASRVRKVAAGTVIVSTVAGVGVAGFGGDGGPSTAARLNEPSGLGLDAAGNLFIADRSNGRVRRVDAASGVITTVAGGGAGGDGPAVDAGLFEPDAVTVDVTGRLYITEDGGARVRRVEAGNLSTFAGAGPAYTGDGAPAASARLVYPQALAFDSAGNLFITDVEQFRVRRVDAGTGVIATIAGNGVAGSSGDGGPATAASIVPRSIAVDAAGNVYIGDASAHVVRKVAAGTGVITTIAGNGSTAYAGDGVLATATGMVPHSLAIDSMGNLYVGDADPNRRVFKVAAGSATVTTVAAPAGPTALVADSADNVYIGLDGGGVAKIAAGSGIVTYLLSTAGIHGLAVDGQGNLYFSENIAGTVRRSLAGSNAISPFAGSGNGFGPLGDGGPAASASLHYLVEGLVYRAGALYIADSGHARVRKVTLPPIEASPAALAFEGRLPQTTSLPKRVTLTNVSGSAIAITSITASGAAFAATHDCGASLAGGASCHADVTFSPSAASAYTGTVVVDAATGILNVAISGSGELSLVTHFYETIMRRTPDSSGKPFWDGEKARMQGLGANINETWFAMSSFFYASNEYQAFNRNPSDFTTDLYKTFFNRAPDAPGLQFWIDQMANGMPREVVLTSFQHSAEFKTFTQGIFGNTAARAEVDMVMDFYRGLLGRLPDTNGFNNWVGQFRTAQCQSSGVAAAVTALAESISEQFATSTEYINRARNNGQYVGDLYNAFLRRGGDLTGVMTWINSLNNSTFTRKQVRDNFRASSEFTARVSAVASQGCMP